MNKYKFTLLFGVLIILIFTQISKPNSGLDNEELFKRIEEKSETIENYINIKDIKVSKTENDDIEKSEHKFSLKDFSNEFFQSKLPKFLKTNKEKQETEVKKNTEVYEYYGNRLRNHILYKDGVPNEYFLSGYLNTGNTVEEDFYLKQNGKMTASLNNIYTAESTDSKIKPFVEYSGDDPYTSLDYKEILPILKDTSKFIDVNEIDEYYIFKKEFKSLDNENIIQLMKDLKLDEEINQSGVITFDEILNSKWDREEILINFTVPSRDLFTNKFMFALTVTKDDIKYGIRFELNLEQFNIVDSFNLEKINKRIEEQ